MNKNLGMKQPRHIAKLTAKNQLTLPASAVQALGRPSHFRVHVSQGALILFPARLASDEEVLSRLTRRGMAPEVVEEVRAALQPK